MTAEAFGLPHLRCGLCGHCRLASPRCHLRARGAFQSIGGSMPSQLAKSRRAAFLRQCGRCFYCDMPIWLDEPDAFRAKYPLTTRQHALRRCTAEHLVAKQDGGDDQPNNIVAACWLCNSRRHRGGIARSPQEHRHRVQLRVRQGGWLPHGTVDVFTGISSRDLRAAMRPIDAP